MAAPRVHWIGHSMIRGQSEDNTLGTELDFWAVGPRLQAYLTWGQAGVWVEHIGTRGHGRWPENAHDGWGGFTIDQITAGVGGWITTTGLADLYIVLLGTNDALAGASGATMLTDMSACLTAIVTADPAARILVSSSPPLGATYAAFQVANAAFNAGLPAVVAAQVALGRRVTFTNAGAQLVAADLFDEIHPSAAQGYPILGRLLAEDALPWLQRLTLSPDPYDHAFHA